MDWMRFLAHYAVAGIVGLTAIPAGCLPTLAAMCLAYVVTHFHQFNFDVPWTALVIVSALLGMIIVVPIISVWVFLWFWAHIRKLTANGPYLYLGLAAWRVLLILGLALGVVLALACRLAVTA